MRLLYVCLDRGVPVGGTKGASIHVEELLRALEDEGHETAVLARRFERSDARPAFRAPTREGLRWIPGRTLRRDLRELTAGSSFRDAVRTALARFRPDVIYERYALFRGEALAEARRAGVPHLLEVNAPLALEERRFRRIAFGRIAQGLEQRLWRETDLLVTPSHALADRARALGQERVLVLSNAVDPERFSTTGASRDALRRGLGLDDRFVIGFAGSLKPWHDLATLITAVSRLQPEIRAALLLLGEGPERAALERRARAAGVVLALPGTVPHERVADFLGAMDVCFVGLPRDPQYQYFSPLKALEYLAAARPAVVADVGELAPLVAAEVALGYTPGDAGGLAEQLARVADDAELRKTLAAAGRTHAESCTWRRTASELVQAAERLVRTISAA